MKKFITTLAIGSLAATSAFAGSLVEPEMEPMAEIVEEDTGSSSSGGLLLPLLALAVIAVIVTNNDSNEE